MANKKLIYEVGFTANVKELNKALAEVQRSLTKISSLSNGEILTENTMQAAKAAQQLSMYLSQAVNVDTGKFDLSRFNAALKKSGLEPKEYAERIRSIGPQGEQAFLQLASAISKAELPLLRSNKLMDELWTAMKGTARWQLTSRALYGFMGGLQTCYGYAKDLNTSLNNIRIVTNKSTEEMAAFAVQANQAAKSLSSTTTEYTNAALIYAQQGLNNKDIKERTNITLKMANVSRESAEEVSNQLTAIWNNFADGTKSLESYADVITALGAKTSSSSREISDGIEKFAAVGKSVGLSYEYAASALATVTAKTRQSADIVGNAFKTLFARIQGLNLGETLEDGTTLNKYSEAMEKVGVSIKDQHGELKEMDNLLEDTAERWTTLTQDQRVALAQTVAGVRQYTQFIALMDNWDFMQENLQTSRESEGTLQEQADIYAESWEAARDRVRAAAEDIYDSIINPDMFIEIDNVLTPFLEGIATAIDSLGGLKGVLVTTGYIITNLYGEKISQSLRDAAYNISYLTGKEVEYQRELQTTMAQLAERFAVDASEYDATKVTEVKVQAQKIKMQIELNEKAKDLNSIQYEQLQNEISFIEKLGMATANLEKQASAAKETAEALSETFLSSSKVTLNNKQAGTEYNSLRSHWKTLNQDYNVGKKNSKLSFKNQIFGKDRTTGDIKDLMTVENMIKGIERLSRQYGKLNELKTQIKGLDFDPSSNESFEQAIVNAKTLTEEFKELTGTELDTSKYKDALDQITKQSDLTSKKMHLLGEVLQRVFQIDEAPLEQFIQNCQEAATAENGAAHAGELLHKTTEDWGNLLDSLLNSGGDWADTIVNIGNQLLSINMIIQSLSNIPDMLNRDDLSTTEKTVQLFISLTEIIPPLITTYQNLNKVIGKNTLTKIANKKITEGLSAALFAHGGVTINDAGALKLHTGAILKNTAALAAQHAALLWSIAAIGGAIALIYASVKAYNANAEAAKEAEDSSRKLAEAAEVTAEKLNDIKSAIDSYDSAVDKLNECTKGTQEWNDALVAVHEQIDDIITKFPELLSDPNLFNADGTLNQDALNQAVKNAEDAKNAARAASLQGKVTAAQARLTSDITNASRKYQQLDSINAMSYNTGYNSKSTRTVQEDLDDLLKSYKNFGSEALELTDVYDTLGDITAEYASELLQLGKNSLSATNMLNSSNQLLVQSWAGTHDEELVTGQSQLMGGYYQADYESFAKAFKEADKNSRFNSTDISVLGAQFANTRFKDMSITDAFNAARGTDYSLASNGIRGSGKDREYVFNENGEEKTYRLEEMQATVAAAAALENLEQTAGKAGDVLTNLSKKASSETAEGIQNFIANGNLESMSQEEYEKMRAEIGNQSIKSYLTEAFGGIDPDTILGPDFTSDFITAATNYGTAFQTFKDNLLKSVQNAYNDLDSELVKVVDVTGQKALAQAMQDAMVYAGDEGLEVVKNTISSLDEDNIQDFANVLGSMDWETQDAEDFIQALEDAGVETEEMDGKLRDLGEVMSQVSKSADFSVLSKKYAEIHKITDSLKSGDTIDSEVFDKLTEAQQGYFTKMLDGTYKLTGDAENFYELVRNQSLEGFKERKDFLSNQVSSLEGVQGYNFEDLSQSSSYHDTQVKQLELLEAMGHSQEQIAEWRENFKNNEITSQDLDDIANAVRSYSTEFENINQKIKDSQEEIYQLNVAIVASTAQSIGELRAAQVELNIAEEDYAEILDQVTKREAEAYDLDVDDIKDLAEAYLNEADAIVETEDEARALAIQNLRMNKGVEKLVSSWEDWSSVIKKVKLGELNKTSKDYIDTIQDLTDVISDLVGASKDLELSDAFFDSAENVELLEKAAQGSETAINQLGVAVAIDLVNTTAAAVDTEQAIKDVEAAMNDCADAEIAAGFEAQIDALQNLGSNAEIVKNGFNDLFAALETGGAQSVNALVQSGNLLGIEWQKALNELAFATNMTVDEMRSMLESAGVEAEVIPIEKDVMQQVPEYTTYEDVFTIDEGSEGKPARYRKVSRTVQTDTKTLPGKIQVAQINMGEANKGNTPTVKPIRYVGSGSGGIAPSSKKSSSKGSNGGSSGSTKEDKPKKKEETPLDETLERYHEINDQIDDVTRATKKLNTETDRLYGVKKFANMDKEISKLKQQNSLLEEKTKQAKNYLGTIDSGDMGALAKAAKDVGFSLTADSFDAAGNLLNVEEIQRSMWTKLHEMEVHYNNLATGTEQDTYEEQVIKPWQEKTEEFSKALELYEETRELMQDLEEERLEILQEIEDIRFEKIVASIEIHLDKKDAIKEINELAKVIKKAVGEAYDWTRDSAILDYTNAMVEWSKFENPVTGAIGEYQKEYAELVKLVEESKTNSAIDQEALAEQFEELRGQIIDSAEALVEWAESLEDVLPDAIDAAREHFDQFINQLDHNTTVVDTIKEIMVLQGMTIKTTQGFSDIEKLHQERMDATLAQAKLHRQWYDKARGQLQQAEAALERATQGTEEYDILKANRDALLEEFNNAQEAMLESAKETMEEARKMYEDEISRASYELEQKLTKGVGFDLLQDKYDHYIERDEMHLDLVNKIYETTTLNNKLQKELDKTSNLSAANKLKALQEEFRLREANTELSQYDIDIMNAKLDMTLKQIALEEAQNNKSDLRLVRNAQGNWNYQYVANEGDIEQATQEYLDAMRDYYNMAKQEVKDVTAEIIETWQQMAEEIDEVYRDETLTVEEREAKIAEIREHYTAKLEELEQKKQVAIKDMSDAGQQVITHFRKTHKDEIDKMGGDVDKLTDIYGKDFAEILTGTGEFNNDFGDHMDDLSSEVTDFEDVFDGTIDDMNDAAQDYQDNITEVNDEVGVSYDDLKDMIDEVSDSTEEITDQGYDEIDMMWDKIDEVRTLTEEYAALADQLLETAEAMRELADATVHQQFDEVGGIGFDMDTDYSALMSNYLASGGTTGDETYKKLLEQRDNKIDWLGKYGGKDKSYWKTYGQETTDMFNQIMMGSGDQEWFKNAQKIYGDKWKQQLAALGIPLFDTGGYTGRFEDAKLAFLHEKELVLNPDDTKNILSAVQSIRTSESNLWQTIAKVIESNILVAQGTLLDRLGNILMSFVQVPPDQSPKEATIYAEFPNVHDARDLEEALRNLANDATQYASQYGRR